MITHWWLTSCRWTGKNRGLFMWRYCINLLIHFLFLLLLLHFQSIIWVSFWRLLIVLHHSVFIIELTKKPKVQVTFAPTHKKSALPYKKFCPVIHFSEPLPLNENDTFAISIFWPLITLSNITLEIFQAKIWTGTEGYGALHVWDHEECTLWIQQAATKL